MWLCRVRVNLRQLVFLFIDTTEKKSGTKCHQINCDFSWGTFFCFIIELYQGADVSVSVLHLIPDDCWCWLRHGYKRCIWLRQSVSRSMAKRWQHSSSYWTLVHIVNFWHQHKAVMFKWRKLFYSCKSWINVGEMWFDSWCWSAHFHLNTNGKLVMY